MQFYHYSENKFDILKPQIGMNRNDSEDDNAIGVPVIFLTQDIIFVVDEITCEYRYTVIIEESDPELHVDRKHQEVMNDFNRQFNTREIPWHFYTADLLIHKVERWNGAEYV